MRCTNLAATHQRVVPRKTATYKRVKSKGKMMIIRVAEFKKKAVRWEMLTVCVADNIYKKII